MYMVGTDTAGPQTWLLLHAACSGGSLVSDIPVLSCPHALSLPLLPITPRCPLQVKSLCGFSYPCQGSLWAEGRGEGGHGGPPPPGRQGLPQPGAGWPGSWGTGPALGIGHLPRDGERPRPASCWPHG